MSDGSDGLDSFVHAGSTFSNDAFSRVKDVKVLGGTDNLRHFVFAIPYAHMFQSPMKFGDFRSSSEAQALRTCLTFFLDMCYSIASAKSKEQKVVFNDTVCMLETCKHCEKDRYVGTRIHVFTTRCPSELQRLFKTFEFNMELSKKKNVTLGEFERHRMVTSVYGYASRIVNVYLGNTHGTSVVDTMFDEAEVDHELAPSSVFSLANMHLENATYNDPDDYARNGDFVFPDENNVLRIAPDMLHPDMLMPRYLPDYLMYRVNPPEAHVDTRGFVCHMELKHHELRVDPPGLVLEDNRCTFPVEERAAMEAKMAGFRMIDICDDTAPYKCSFGFFTFRSLVASTAKVNTTSYMSMESTGEQVLYHPMLVSQSKLSDIDIIKIRGDRMKGVVSDEKRRRFMLSEFKQRCWGDTDANISKPLKAVIRWFNSDYDGTTFAFKRHYNDLSVFANRAIRLMKVYDKLFMISTAHHAFLLINTAKLDSWRHTMDLHFNICSTGDGATSKSFLYELMIENSIPGTCPEFTYETAKSNAHDDNNNHLRNVFQEAPQGMFTSNKHTDPQQEAAFKERLTSQKTSHRRLHIDETTGVRKQVSSVSQAIGCYFGASNDPKSKSTPAMITRFHWLDSEKIHRSGRNIHDCQRALVSMSERAQQMRGKQLTYARREDMIVALTQQFIRMGILQPPTLVVADILIDNFTILLKKYGISLEGRDIERVKILCGINTIIGAQERLFNVVGGKHCGKSFELEQLLDMDDQLVCTEEIALFSLGCVFNSIEGENKKKVLKAIWRLHSHSKKYRGMDMGSTSVDHGYIMMDSLKRLKQQIHGSIPESEGKIGAAAIYSVLGELSKEQIECFQYEDAASATELTFADGYPEPVQGQRPFRQERLIVDGQMTYIHVENFRVFRENRFSDLFKECLDEIRHRFTQRRKIVIGRRIRNERGIVEHPHLLDVYEMSTREQYLMVSGGTSYDDSDWDIFEGTEDAENRKLEQDLDTYGYECRSLQLGRSVQMDPAVSNEESSAEYPADALRTLFRKRKRVTT